MGSQDVATELLFSYGTLQLEAVQRSTFGRRLVGVSDALTGFKVVPFKVDDPAIVGISGKAVRTMATPTGRASDVILGTVFAVTPTELEHSDKYEAPAFKRVSVTLRSGARAWVSIDATADDLTP